VIEKLDNFIEKNLTKNTFKLLLKYLLFSSFLYLFLMSLHRPATFYSGSFLDYIKYMYDIGYLYEILFTIISWSPVLAASLFLFKTRYIGVLFLALFSFLAGTEMYYFYLQGGGVAWNIGVNQLMVENIIKALENPVLMGEASSEYSKSPLFLKYMVYYPLGIFISIFIILKFIPKGKFNILGLPLTLILLTFSIEQSTPFFYRVIFEFQNYGIEKVYNIISDRQREKVYIYDINKTYERPKNIIFLMDESVRGDFISVNSKDPEIINASSYLKELQDTGLFKTFGVMYPIGNCSASSNTFTMTGGRKNYQVAPTIFQYMKNAGYKTTRLDAPHTGYQNGVERYDSKYIDQYITKEFILPNTERDLESIKEIAKILKNGKSNFIYFTKQGSHFPVNNSYPKSSALYTDLGPKYSQGWYKKQYLNSIYWNVNYTWKELIKTIKGTNTIVIWQSDHGLNIAPDQGETRILLTHCETSLNHYRSLFNGAGGIYSENKKILDNYKNINESSAMQIFPTLLSIAGYKDVEIEKFYWPSFKTPIKNKDKTFPLYTPSYKNFFDLNKSNFKENNIELKDFGINQRKESTLYNN